MQVTCSDCGAKYQVRDEHRGKSLRCKSCQTVITIPAGDDEMFGGFAAADWEAPSEEGMPPRQRKPRKPQARSGAGPDPVLMSRVMAGLCVAMAVGFVVAGN